MITIIFAPPRFGKTALMTHFLNKILFDRQHTKAMWKEIKDKNANGFKLSYPLHTVFSNYTVTGKKFGYNPRTSYYINPYRLGYFNDKVETHFIPPFATIGITEGQKYFNSRMSMWYPDWQSRFYEQHGHNHIDIFIDVQRPNLIDINIRELASFIEVLNLKVVYDKQNNIKKLVWKVRLIDNSSLLERYFTSGKKDKDTFTEEIITTDYNVFDCYDSRNCKPKFYDGHFGKDFSLKLSEIINATKDGYKEFVKNFDDELPQNFYSKRSKE